MIDYVQQPLSITTKRFSKAGRQESNLVHQGDFEQRKSYSIASNRIIMLQRDLRLIRSKFSARSSMQLVGFRE